MAEQLRAALLARVSSEEQVEGYSLDAQTRAFRSQIIEGRGWTSYKEYMEEGRSAHTDDIRKRPVFQEAIKDALETNQRLASLTPGIVPVRTNAPADLGSMDSIRAASVVEM